MKIKIKWEKIRYFIVNNKIYIFVVCYGLFLLTLSLFRNATADETIYLKETMLISELLKSGTWIGNYGVGLHGFLFKLPVALAFIILGEPSVFVATLFTIALSLLSLLVFNKFLQNTNLKREYHFWAILLFSSFLYFINMSVSFNRDIPAIFTSLIFINLVLEKKSHWLIGGCLLLLLDAKEHVFFTYAASYLVFLFLESFYFSKVKLLKKKLKYFVVNSFKAFIFSVIWLLLMFGTSFIPMNMFVANQFGLIAEGIESSVSQFKPSVATRNLLDEGGKEIPKVSNIPLIQEAIYGSVDKVEEECVNKFLCTIISIIDLVISYVGKLLYPRTFSFVSIPKIIILPAVLTAVVFLSRWLKKKDIKALIPIILFVNLIAILLRASHGRYLLPVASIISYFFILFIQKDTFKDKYFKRIVIFAFLFDALGLIFESTYVIIKIIISVISWTLFGLLIIFRNKGKVYDIYSQILLLFLSISMIATTLVFSYKIGQIKSYLNFGNSLETKEISSEFDDDERIWINSYGSPDLLQMYRKDTNIPAEWHWQLSDIVPKKYLLSELETQKTFSSPVSSFENLHIYVTENKIEKLGLVTSDIEDIVFNGEELLPDFFVQDWLKFERKVSLQNKQLYIFAVK